MFGELTGDYTLCLLKPEEQCDCVTQGVPGPFKIKEKVG